MTMRAHVAFETGYGPPPILLAEELMRSTGDSADTDKVQAVIDYAETMRADCHYRLSELDPRVAQLYEVARYAAEVEAGGHTRYIRSRSRHDTEWVVLVRNGLEAMRANANQRLFDKVVRALIEYGPGATLPHPGKFEAIMTQLDTAFTDAARHRDLAVFAARWIQTWRGVQTVPDAELDDHYARLAEANPFLRLRTEATRAREIGFWFTDRPTVAAGLLLGMSEEPDMLVSLEPGPALDHRGLVGQSFRLKAAEGVARLVMLDNHYALHAPATKREVREERDRRRAGNFPQHGARDERDRMFLHLGIGRFLGSVPPALVDHVLRLARGRHTPIAAHDLLARAKVTEPVTEVGWLSGEEQILRGEISWLLRAGEAFYTLVMLRDRFELFRHGQEAPLGMIGDALLRERAEELGT